MKKPSAATVIATIALFVALGGTGYAAVALAPDSVGSAQIRDGAVQSSDIKDGAIRSSDIANGAIKLSDLTTGALKGLDGKDGARGPAGPAGPPGPAGNSASCTWVPNSLATADVHTVCTDSDLVGRVVGDLLLRGDFSGSDLTGTFINGNNGYGANFNHATLIGFGVNGGGSYGGFGSATFVGANLTKTYWGNHLDLTNADFSGANLTNAAFESANLTGATFNQETNLSGVRWVIMGDNHQYSDTRCPDGSLAIEHDDTCIGYLTAVRN